MRIVPLALITVALGFQSPIVTFPEKETPRQREWAAKYLFGDDSMEIKVLITKGEEGVRIDLSPCPQPMLYFGNQVTELGRRARDGDPESLGVLQCQPIFLALTIMQTLEEYEKTEEYLREHRQKQAPESPREEKITLSRILHP